MNPDPMVQQGSGVAEVEQELHCGNAMPHRAHRYFRLPSAYYTCQGRTAEFTAALEAGDMDAVRAQLGVEVAPQEPVHDHIFGVRCRPACPRWGSTTPQPGWETPQDWYFTFGGSHVHPDTRARLGNSFVRIHGTCDSTREVMLAAFGNRWSNQYMTAEQAGVERFGLIEASMPGAEQDDEALREVYAQDEADQDRVPTEAGFDVWKSLRRAVGQGTPNTPAEARTGISDVQAVVREQVAAVRRLLDTLIEAATEHEFDPESSCREDILARLDRIEALAGGGRL